MLEGLKCRLKGHKSLCQQMITLMADNTAILDHEHRCLRCGKVKQFPQEPVEDQMIEMLLRLVEPQRVPVSMDVDPPTYIH